MMMQFAKIYEMGCNGQLAKGEGAGSRGGNVIGHTKSGKPIYGGSRKLREPLAGRANLEQRTRIAKKVISAHPGWSSQDHEDAADAHRMELDKGVASAAEAHFHGASAGRHRGAARHLRAQGK